jgi:hypothetical protein
MRIVRNGPKFDGRPSLENKTPGAERAYSRERVRAYWQVPCLCIHDADNGARCYRLPIAVNSLAIATPFSRPIATPVRGPDWARPWSDREGPAAGAARPDAVVMTAAGVFDQLRFLNRQLVLPVSMMSQWWVRRSSMAVVILASPNTCGQSAKARLVVISSEVFS